MKEVSADVGAQMAKYVQLPGHTGHTGTFGHVKRYLIFHFTFGNDFLRARVPRFVHFCSDLLLGIEAL